MECYKYASQRGMAKNKQANKLAIQLLNANHFKMGA